MPEGQGCVTEVLEDHIRLHLLGSEKDVAPPDELAEDLIDLVCAIWSSMLPTTCIKERADSMHGVVISTSHLI